MGTTGEYVSEIIKKQFNDNYNPVHQKGPDYVVPTKEFRTWLSDGIVNINVAKDTDADFEPESVVTYLKNTVDEFPNNLALAVKRNGYYVKWTYKQYWDDVRTAAKGFIKLGLSPFHGVCILGFNSPEWLISYLAAIFAGGIGAGIYVTNSPEACYHVINDCKANIIVVENETQLHKILSIKESLPHLRAIVQYIGKSKIPEVVSWEELLQIGKSLPEVVLEKRIKSLSVNHCCTLIYTSGTTGNPKGVMMSHDNLVFTTKYVLKNCKPINKGKEVSVSYLPLSHVAGLLLDTIIAIGSASAVYFAAPDALKGTLVNSLLEAQPTSMIGVPRVYEKIYEGLRKAETKMSYFHQTLFAWARMQAFNFYSDKNSYWKYALYLLAKILVLNKVKRSIGLENVIFSMVGAAPLLEEIQKYFVSIDLPLRMVYGMSESTGGHIFIKKDSLIFASCGNIHVMSQNESKIIDPDENGNGEILIRGRHVSMGYLNLEDMTKETIDEDRWLHSGDIGRIDQDGNLFVTGRLKELIITAGGENIPPILIEEEVKKLLPVVSNCILIGDRRKYLTMLITLKTEVDGNTLVPVDKLSSSVIEWCKSFGSKATTVSEILINQDKKVMDAIQEGIDTYNKKVAISNAQKIQKWAILPKDFSMASGEIGPTAKLKRPVIINKNSEIIEGLYR